MKNPPWQRDELILALDLYFKLEPGQIHARNKEVIELSEILNQLPIHSTQNKNQKFRNPNGVGLKLSNFLAIDPDYSGKGMERGSKLDKQVFEEFHHKINLLVQIANNIKTAITDPNISPKIYAIKEDLEDDLSMVKEGKILYRLHKTRERNTAIVKKKKDQAFKKYGKLACEICEFDFEAFYGHAGKGFIECHHITPLAELSNNQKTKLDDLMLVCSNCHRMLHRGWMTNMGISNNPRSSKK